MSRRWKLARGADPEVIEQARLSSVCAWCKKQIPLDAPVVTFGIKAPANAELTMLEGKFTEMPLPDGSANVVALVTHRDSPAKKEGQDLMFMACSEPCAQSLREGLGIEASATSADQTAKPTA